MAKSKNTIAELVQPALAPGEQLVGTVRVTYNGTVPPNMHVVSTGITALSPEQTDQLDPDAALSFPTANQMALALTNQRIFAWALSMTGKPSKFVGEVALAGISRVDESNGSYGSGMRVRMKSTAIIDLEFMRHEPGEEFARQLVSLLPETPEASGSLPPQLMEDDTEDGAPDDTDDETGPAAD